jgi:dTDP-4-dehydrorhamnose reductase
MKVCVIGDTGLLGQAVVRGALAEGYQVLGISTSGISTSGSSTATEGYRHETMDLVEDAGGLDGLLRDQGPQWVVNCTGLVNLALCETDTALAERLNATLPGDLARLAHQLSADYTHISTDQVFAGSKQTPHNEDDALSPLNNYGRTKLQGERHVMEAHPGALVARTNIVGFRDRAGRPTFAEWLVEALASGREIMLAEDFITSSIHVDFLTEVLIRARHEGLSGVWHMASHDPASKYRFGELLASRADLSLANVTKGSVKDLGLKPPRPAYLALDVSRAEEELNMTFADSVATTARLAADFKLRTKET